MWVVLNYPALPSVPPGAFSRWMNYRKGGLKKHPFGRSSPSLGLAGGATKILCKSRTSGCALDFETRKDELAGLDVQFKMIVKLFIKLELRLIKAEDNLIAHDCLKEIPNKFKSLPTGHSPLSAPYLKSVATVARTSFVLGDEDDSVDAEVEE